MEQFNKEETKEESLLKLIETNKKKIEGFLKEDDYKQALVCCDRILILTKLLLNKEGQNLNKEELDKQKIEYFYVKKFKEIMKDDKIDKTLLNKYFLEKCDLEYFNIMIKTYIEHKKEKLTSFLKSLKENIKDNTKFNKNNSVFNFLINLTSKILKNNDNILSMSFFVNSKKVANSKDNISKLKGGLI
jgi:hypothetical protein